MRDTELYRHLLGLQTPWKVGRVELSATDGRVDVWVEHPARTRFACPDCDPCDRLGLERPISDLKQTNHQRPLIRK
jgi:hypothetical protein